MMDFLPAEHPCVLATIERMATHLSIDVRVTGCVHPQRGVGTMTQHIRQSGEILVVGAGPVGLTMASELARHDTPCRIVDASSRPVATSRALGIFPRTLEVFENIGVIEAILGAGHKLHGIHISAAGQRLASLNLNDIESPYPFMISLPQSATERILSTHLAQMGGNVERQVELLGFTQDNQGVTATLRHLQGQEETVRTPWLIGCDGAHSTVRHTLSLPFPGARYDETFILADVTLQASLPDDEVSLFFHPDGILGLIPFGSGRYRVVADIPPAALRHPDEPTLVEVQTLARTRGPADITLRDPTWLSAFHIARRKVDCFRAGRVFVAGDAAHIHSPVGGQGMNTGIQDATNLAWKLALVNAHHAPQSLLDSYSIEREPVAHDVLTLTDRMTKVATLHNPVAQHIRDLVLPFLAGIEFLQHRMATTLAEVAIDYRHSPIVAQHWSGAFSGLHRTGVVAGDRAPDGPLQELTTGVPRRLFELLRGTRHTLLLFGGEHATPDAYSCLEKLGQDVQEHYGEDIAVYMVIAGTQHPRELAWEGKVLYDSEHVLHQRYGADAPCLYLIRPDGYIGFRSLPARSAYLREYLAKHIFFGNTGARK
jgi:2-polyprenyl-6-methoxyphenol hydroxylase-like FAD-dependent oxidoreductase